jgi:hypothetical protein
VKKLNFGNWKKYGFDFLSIFVAVVAAFALNNWNDNRRDNLTENKILLEISNGLEKDIDDIQENVRGHNLGLVACNYFRKAFAGNEIAKDSMLHNYYCLTRDYVTIQNSAGYEALKSKGLELIKNDTLRLKIISLYEYDYSILSKLEEEYGEGQFHQSYFKEINEELAPNFIMDSTGNVIGINSPLKIKEENKNKLLLYLWKIQSNRMFVLHYYSQIEAKVKEIRKDIKELLKD